MPSWAFKLNNMVNTPKELAEYAINWYNSLTNQQKIDAINSTPNLRGKQDITDNDKIKIYVFFHYKG